MDRDTIKDCFSDLDKIAVAVETLPYSSAASVLRMIECVRSNIGGDLPGGFFGFCENCEMPLGCDDDMARTEDDCTICDDCYRAAVDASQPWPARKASPARSPASPSPPCLFSVS